MAISLFKELDEAKKPQKENDNPKGWLQENWRPTDVSGMSKVMSKDKIKKMDKKKIEALIKKLEEQKK